MRRYTALAAVSLALAAAALGVAPAAYADHLAPTATATLELGGRATDDCDQVSGFPRPLCGGARRATVSWSVSCGAATGPGAIEEVSVSIVGVRPTGRRFGYAGESFNTATGSVGMTVGPGLRFLAEVEVSCYVETTNADGDLVEHRARATGETQQIYRPPFLQAHRTLFGSFCGVSLPGTRSSRVLQAGQYAELAWYLRYSAPALIRPGRSELRQIKLFARGAGIRLKTSPDPSILRGYDAIGTGVRPRRAGKLRIWATIGGKRTNTKRVTVLPKRC